MTDQTKYVYDLNEGDASLKSLLGGKGANLAEMNRIGVPVPVAFTLTTEAGVAAVDNKRGWAGGARERGLRRVRAGPAPPRCASALQRSAQRAASAAQ